MKLKTIQESPANKTATKSLLNNSKYMYLEITEDIDDIQILDHLIMRFLSTEKGSMCFGPIGYNYNDNDNSYIAFVTDNWVVKWNNIMYDAGDIIGTIKDREMI